MALRKPPAAPMPGDPEENPHERDSFAEERPVLWDYLTCPFYEDGSPRDLSSLTIFTDEGRFKACLNDKALSRVCFVSADSFMGTLDTLESQLAMGTADWRKAKNSGRQNFRK